VTEVTIRPYHTDDFDTVTSIWISSWESTGVIVAEPTTLAELREQVPREMPGAWSVHVATVASDIVGFVAFAGSELKQLYIAPHMQGRGIGTRLLDVAKAQMPDGFTLVTALDSRAVQFYENRGLQRGEVSRNPKHGTKIVRFSWVP
jgi:GNAT superfamily N-acetyltransferase